MTDSKAIAARHKLVVKANDIIQKSRFSLSLQQQKIILYLISQIEPADEELKDFEFSISDFCRTCGIIEPSGKNYRELKTAIKGIRDQSMWVTLPNGNETLVSWIGKAYINNNSGTVLLRLDEDMKPFLLQLKSNFTRYELIWILRFKSKYSIRLYELIKSIHFADLESYTRVFPLDQLQRAMDASSYSQFKDFHTRALKPAVKEINLYSDKTLSYALVKKGKAVSAVQFTIGTKSAEDRLQLVSETEDILGREEETAVIPMEV